ncbi:TonB family protein [Campylobacter majalis]|uniref:TonB family protein n=1 Tax=Campylobacter majalis TaxID=2790656 RepID=UPI003D6991E4
MEKQNFAGNVISFIISFIFHAVILGFIFGVFTKNKPDTLMAQEPTHTKTMAINLNQISQKQSSESMQATQQSTVKEIKSDEILTQVEQKKIQAPKPIKKPVEKIKSQQNPKKVVKIPTQEPEKIEQNKQSQEDVPKTTVAASSASTAQNQSVQSGGTIQSGKSEAENQASARTILGEIYAAILKHKTYPKRAIKAKSQGKVYVEFKAISQSSFEYLRVVKSSGSEFLDRHAEIILNKAVKDFPVEAIGKQFKVAINFNLKDI